VSASLVRAEEPAATATSTPHPATLENTISAGEADDDPPERDLVKWNHYEGKFFSIRVGGGFLYEGAAYAQDDESKEQFALHPDSKVRDARLSLRGRFKFKREVTWTSGIMYDGPPTSSLFARQASWSPSPR
jgi:hypothetical protein